MNSTPVRPSSSPELTTQQNNFELQIEINKKDQNAENKLEKSILLENDDLKYVDENAERLKTNEDIIRNLALSEDTSKYSKFSEDVEDEKHDNPTDFMAASSWHLEKKKVNFDNKNQHYLSNEYEKITTNCDTDIDSLFETKTKQNLIKSFKFNSDSKKHIKNMKFNYSETACQNNHNLQRAKMAFYDTLLNKGGNNLNNKYLKDLKHGSARSNKLSNKSYNKFENEFISNSNMTLNNIYTTTAETLTSQHLESARSVNSRLPDLKRNISGNTSNQNYIMDKINDNRTKDNIMVTHNANNNNKSNDIQNDPALAKRCEASEYYNNKIRLIANLVDKHNAKKEFEAADQNIQQNNNQNKIKKSQQYSATSRKSKKNRNFEDSQNINSHLTASFPSIPYSNNHNANNNSVVKGINPFKTTKLDRQFKRVIHIDHNKRFNSKSSVFMGDNISQTSEKPLRERPNKAKHAATSILKLTNMLEKSRNELQDSNKANMVKLKFPSINRSKNSNKEYDDKDKIFTSSSFVKSESAYKDCLIKS